MMTGNNPELAARLLLVQFDRIGRGGPKTWVDAGYCIDAPNTLAAGSTERDQFGRDEDDWVDMPTTIERESPNAEFTGLRGFMRRSGGMMGSASCRPTMTDF